MWLVAGCIQPAVDLTAGEKERGTMETLLISPAERSEIVLGKFFAVTFFGFSSVIWNVVCLTVAALIAQGLIGQPIVNLPGMLGCVVLGVPIAMLFSAVSLALGVFARSTKEGQYYLIPLMLISLPLAFWSFIPTTELTPVTAVVPVTGGMLFQQKLLAVSGEPVPWEMFPLVLGAQLVYVGLALAAAWCQFRREAVLFREMGPTKTRGLFRRG
jgi:sodium transport system permease protein